MGRSILLLLPGLLLPGLLSAGPQRPNPAAVVAITVMKCVLPNGEVLFTDRHCPGETAEQEATATADIMLIPGLSKQTQQRAEELSAAQLQNRQAVRAERRKVARALAEQKREREKLCRQTRAQLEDLRNKRRRGYSVKNARTLARQEDALRDTRRTHCY